MNAGVGRVVEQRPERRGHRLQPSWVNASSHRSRFDQIALYLRGRSVLDIGCASGRRRPDWFHGLISSVASEAVGVDVDADAVEELCAAGHRIVLANAADLDLHRTFDVVHAGELIEHVDDPRGFLVSAWRHLGPDSLLVLTTPNAFCVSNFVYRFGGRARVNRDHVAWYCEDTLTQLLARNGFEVVELRYLRHTSPSRWRALLGRIVRGPLPDRLAWNTLLVVARKAHHDD